MAKDIKFQAEARSGLAAGVTKLADAVKVTPLSAPMAPPPSPMTA